MMNLKKRIKKIFAINNPPYFQDTKFCKKCVDLTIENRLLLRDRRKLTESLNECYSTIAALENGNNELKLKIKQLEDKK